MARRKSRRTYKRRSSPIVKRRRSRSGAGSGGEMQLILGGIAYGVLRGMFSAKVDQFLANSPLSALGKYGDNIVFGGIAYAMSKGKIPFINKMAFSRSIGKAGLGAEAVLLGADLGLGLSGLTNGNSEDMSAYQ